MRHMVYTVRTSAPLCMRIPHWRNEDKTNAQTSLQCECFWERMCEKGFERFERLCLIVTGSWFINDTYDCC